MPVSLMQSLANTVGFYLMFATTLAVYALRKRKSLTKKELAAAQADERPKVVVVTGCDSGFGKLMAESWTNSEKVIVVALTLTKEGAASLEAYNKEHAGDPSFVSPIVPMRCDVTSSSDVDLAKTKIGNLLKERKAVLHGIVNNAGICSPGDFVFYRDLTIPKKIMEVNFFGQLAVTQALLPFMLSTSKVVGGKIVNLSSVCGTGTGNPGNSLYCASKHAVEAWSASLRIELEDYHIDVCTIRPGQTSTTIQDDYVNNLVKNYESAPDQIRKLYGGASYAKSFIDWYDFIGGRDHAKMTPAKEVVDTIAGILASPKKPAPHYWVGSDAHTLFKALDALPTRVVDAFKSAFMTPPKGAALPLPKASSTPPKDYSSTVG